jgi:hypothetical protein
MKMLLLAMTVVLIAGCSQRWVQAGKTDLDARRDEFECENTIVTKHGGWSRVEPFTAAMEINECMQLKGYHIERN